MVNRTPEELSQLREDLRAAQSKAPRSPFPPPSNLVIRGQGTENPTSTEKRQDEEALPRQQNMGPHAHTLTTEESRSIIAGMLMAPVVAGAAAAPYIAHSFSSDRYTSTTVKQGEMDSHHAPTTQEKPNSSLSNAEIVNPITPKQSKTK